MTRNLETARIISLPPDAFYIADFISEDEEKWLLQKVNPYPSAPIPRWTQLSHRRLQTWPSALTKTNTLLDSPLPPWLISPIIEPRFAALGIFDNAPHGAPNHVLVNEYRPGQGIMPHEDGTAYYPLVATVSLGAPIVLDLYAKKHRDQAAMEGSDDSDQVPDSGAKPQFRILQERRSLLITRGLLYTEFLHGIAESRTDEDLGPYSICNWPLLRERDSFHDGWYRRETRTSLTYRDVAKVAKMGGTLKFMGGK
ncbi:hypothetical protein N7532_010605 [Penicillium argentinense]|uniref:Fe2OG dioxygenase domain-containing protein n=1 Tax=Penicillium argentinense TaxID=1131581 RepID=A0A9W9EQ35_9EURO|nr:uncharacterized protein N7532_010605 [Penicillium argentinense]KAJ5085834.1 hypothetical protein N7532_010605 [Penicillium argentinense]